MPEKPNQLSDQPPILGNRALPAGRQFYGAIQKSRTLGPLKCSVVAHEMERSIPAHTHDLAYFSLILQGSCAESCWRGNPWCVPFTTKFLPQGTQHSGKIGQNGVEIFTLELDNDWLRGLDLELPQVESQENKGGDLTWLALRMYREFLEQTDSGLISECLALEMLGKASALAVAGASAKPVWWSRAIELVHARFNSGLAIAEVAREAGVHPVYLARVFRRLCGQTPGEYVQRLQVRFACEHLTNADRQLAEIACLAGFADQSHLTRVFKRYTGATPGQVRITCAPKNTATPAI